jgi:hypothetical protein
MERREGPEYAFNEPLLATALQRAPGDVIILMLFLLPGRHAGPDGDVATIAKEHAKPGAQVHMSPLLATHPRLLELLVKRSGLPAIKRRPHQPSIFYALGATLCFLLALGLGSGTAGFDTMGMTSQIATVAVFVLVGTIVLLRRRS